MIAMIARARCHGSCGEVIQGFIGGRELLVSCPVDLYSEVVLRDVPYSCIDQGHKKSRKALEKTFEFFGLPREDTYQIEIQIDSSIPVGKGMASSTADIVATVKASAVFLGKRINPEEVAKIALSIEPTDSVCFHGLTLFDHLKGEVVEPLGKAPPLNVLVLEPPEVLDTLKFREVDYSEIKRKDQPRLERALRLLKEGIRTQNSLLIGEAATISSIANEKVLEKPDLLAIIRCAKEAKAVGVNVAHSGTVIGILIDKAYTDAEVVKAALENEGLLQRFERVYLCKMLV
jgi:L-threonine kinase